MQLINLLTSKIGKSIAIIAIVALLGGCAGVTDAGMTQEQDQPAPKVQVDQSDADKPDQDPFGSGDDVGVIYDEPDL